jgi:CBS-domain-containing membrane protein
VGGVLLGATAHFLVGRGDEERRASPSQRAWTVRLPERATHWTYVIAGAVGGAAAIALMELLAEHTTFPLLFVPFATSIVLVMGSPEAEPAQPRALVGGHLVSAAVGLLVLQVTGPGPWAAAAAVGLAIIAMHATRTFHPPAGIDPLVIVVNGMPLYFFLVPVAAGAFLLVVFAFLWHNIVRRGSWPLRWW